MQKEFFEELKEIILSHLSAEELKDKLENYHSSDIADVLQNVAKEDRLRVYAQLSLDQTAEIFSFYDDVEKYIEELSPETAADILEAMNSEDAMDVLDELEDESKTEIIELMEADSKEKVKQLDAYDEDCIGRYMSDNFIVIDNRKTIKEAMATMVREAGEHDNIFTLYVVDEKNKFYGAINLRDLIVARKEDNLLDICMTSYPSFYDDELMKDCIGKLKDYAENSIPVLNRQNEILGVIPVDSIIDAAEEEMSDDYAKLGGLSESEDLDESILTSIKKRIPWLIILLFLGLVVSSVIGVFEGVIATLPVIVFFQSMILDMAGNVGTQSLAVTIRNLTDEEMKKKVRKNVIKEIKIGFLNGLIISIIAFLFVLAFLAIRHQEIVSGDGFLWMDVLKVAGIIAFSLLLAMTLSSFVGTIFPILLNKMHIDPAVASGPFITTINDVVAVVVYYGLTYILFLLFI